LDLSASSQTWEGYFQTAAQKGTWTDWLPYWQIGDRHGQGEAYIPMRVINSSHPYAVFLPSTPWLEEVAYNYAGEVKQRLVNGELRWCILSAPYVPCDSYSIFALSDEMNITTSHIKDFHFRIYKATMNVGAGKASILGSRMQYAAHWANLEMS
jgi:hypothetical protein